MPRRIVIGKGQLRQKVTDAPIVDGESHVLPTHWRRVTHGNAGRERSLIARLGVEDMRRDSETMQNTR